MATELLRNFLHTVLTDGTGSISKRKLLWWMGRSNDTPSVWETLLSEYESIGGDRKMLHGIETAGIITFTYGQPERVTNWAG